MHLFTVEVTVILFIIQVAQHATFAVEDNTKCSSFEGQETEEVQESSEKNAEQPENVTKQFGLEDTGLHIKQIQRKQHLKLVIFDPQSGKELAPLHYLPIKVGKTRTKPLKANGNLVELPRAWNPCTCTDFGCMCCIGFRFSETINQRFCLSLEYNAADLAIQLRLQHNSRTIVNFGFSLSNPPAFCLPLFIPLPFSACLRVYNIRIVGGNVQLCVSLVINVLMNQLFQFQFDCVSFGTSGIQFQRPPLFFNLEAGSAENTASEIVDDQRKDVKLNENYSGISLPDEQETVVVKKGRVRS